MIITSIERSIMALEQGNYLKEKDWEMWERNMASPPATTPITPEIIIQAFKIYTDLSQRPGFPRNWCPVTADSLERMGLRHVRGWIVLDKPIIPGYLYRIEPHHLAEGLDGRRICLTADQFNLGLTIPFPKGVTVMDIGQPFYNRFAKARSINIDDFVVR